MEKLQDIEDKLQNYSLNWLPVEHFYYREFPITTFMAWQDLLGETSFQEYHIAVARNGGPIALFMRRLTLTANRSFRGKVFVFNAYGHRMREIDLLNHNNKHLAELKEKIAFFAFTDEDDIAMLSNDRRLFLLDPFSNEVTERALPEIPSTQEIKDARLQNGVLAIRCEDTQGTSRFYWLSDLYHACELREFSVQAGCNYDIKDFVVLTGRGDRPELVFPTNKGGIYISQGSDSCLPKYNKFSLSGRGGGPEVSADSIGRVRFLALSPGGKYLAIYTQDYHEGGALIIWKSDHRDQFNVETQIDVVEELQQLVWCGEDVVLLVYERSILMVTPSGPMHVKEAVKPGIYCFPEVDGVRIFTHQECSFFENVQAHLVAALSIASIEPSASLIDAYRSYRKHEPSADDDITKIEGDLHRAVIELVKAAGEIFETELRNFLLQAGGFGKKFVAHFEEFSTEEYMKTVHFIRVLHSIRENKKMPLALTFRQLERMKPKGLVKKLMKMNQHYLASQVSKYLNLRSEKVAEDWACRVLKYSLEESDFDLKKRVVKKLGKFENINYIKITEHALQVGRSDVAYALIEKQKSYVEKIPAILRMGNHRKAFEIACENGDPNYIYLVITQIHAQHTKTAKELLEYLLDLCADRYKFQRYIVQYVRQSRNQELIEAMLGLLGHFRYDGFVYDLESIMLVEMRPTLDSVAKKPVDYLKYFSPESSVRVILEELCDLTGQLKMHSVSVNPGEMKAPYQLPFQQKSRQANSVNQTLYNELWKGNGVDSFKAPSKIPERRVDLIKSKFLVDTKNLEKLRALLLDKKGKIKSKAKTVVKDVVEMLLEGPKDQSHRDITRDLINNVSGEEERVKLFILAELYINAMDVAIDMRSREYQDEIRRKAPQSIQSELIDMLEEGRKRKK